MGQWTWVRARWSMDRKRPDKAYRSLTVVPTSSPWLTWSTVGEQWTSFKYLPVSRTPKSGHSKTCVEKGRMGRTQSISPRKEPGSAWSFVRLNALQGSLTDAELTFQIHHHWLSKRTEARIWVHSKREEALPLNEHICWSWLRFGSSMSFQL